MKRLSFFPMSIGISAFILSLILFHIISSYYPVLAAMMVGYLFVELAYLVRFQRYKRLQRRL